MIAMLSLCVEQDTVMAGRYELTGQNDQRHRSPPQTMGRPCRDDRLRLNGILWILCPGAQWRDLPERYGPWKTLYQRFGRYLQPDTDSLTSPSA